MKLFNNTFDILERSMDVRFKRHSLLSSNVANSETPGYKARELDFAGELERVLGSGPQTLEKTNPGHLDLSSGSMAHVVLDETGAVGADGNNVDLDIAMGKLSDNARGYQSAAGWLGVEMRLLKNIARGRGGA